MIRLTQAGEASPLVTLPGDKAGHLLCRRVCVSVLCSLALGIGGTTARAQPGATAWDGPPVIQEFLAAMPAGATAEQFHELVDERVWALYADPDIKLEELEGYVRSGREGPGIAYAAIALIQFKNPSSATAILERALDATVPNTARWYMLNAAPYVLSMGDVWYTGDGALGEEEEDYIQQLLDLAEKAANTSVGNAHALRLIELYDDADLETEPDLGLLRWHVSAYLLGTLDLRDYSLLAELLAPDEGAVFQNLMSALVFAANRDFVAPLRGKEASEISAEMETHLIAQAKRWWSDYLEQHPNGDWRPAVIEGFAQAGYSITSDIGSQTTRQELRRALDSDSDIARYSACRLLNELYGTRFDVERVFLGSKYALGPFDPTANTRVYQKRLLAYWKDVLKPAAAS